MTDVNVTYDADAMIAEAKRQTGFDDSGELPYREGLDVLIETFDRHVKEPEGRKRCHDRLVMLLATRLKCENAFKTIPEIAEQEIKAPIFVTGLPRSGTSALLNLLVSAPDHRGLLQQIVSAEEEQLHIQPGRSMLHQPRRPQDALDLR